MATNYICSQCGVQYAASEEPPRNCPICEDERQYINWHGQQWTTLEELRQKHTVLVKPEGTEVYGVGNEPGFAIGQRALLVKTPIGNILWDCVTVLDEAGIKEIQALGGIAAIAISHPHFHASMVEWSQAFGNAPIYIHAESRQWVMRPDLAIVFWEGETLQLGEGVTLIRAGIHFEGGTILHWAGAEDGRGAIFSGDIFHVSADRRYVSFMRSYPNHIPEKPSIVQAALARVEPYNFERIYGAWWERNVHSNAKEQLAKSAARYFAQVGTPVVQAV